MRTGEVPPPHDASANTATASAQKWAAEIQIAIVEQLGNWRLPVAPGEIHIGPRFARLLVFPRSRTTISQVRNKAEDRKIRLRGMSANPLIESQASGISIDVELPEVQLGLFDVLASFPRAGVS